MLDERTERLINRKLDGELAEGESLELDKRLIRSPEARALLEEQRRIDALAADSLQAVLSEPETATAWPGDPAARAHRRQTPRLYLQRGIAVAAVIVLAVLAATIPAGWLPNESPPPAVVTAQRDSGALQQADLPAPSQGLAVSMAGHDSRHPSQRRRANLLGVFDEETQSLYLLEMNPRPGPDPLVRVNY